MKEAKENKILNKMRAKGIIVSMQMTVQGNKYTIYVENRDITQFLKDVEAEAVEEITQ